MLLRCNSFNFSRPMKIFSGKAEIMLLLKSCLSKLAKLGNALLRTCFIPLLFRSWNVPSYIESRLLRVSNRKFKLVRPLNSYVKLDSILLFLSPVLLNFLYL